MLLNKTYIVGFSLALALTLISCQSNSTTPLKPSASPIISTPEVKKDLNKQFGSLAEDVLSNSFLVNDPNAIPSVQPTVIPSIDPSASPSTLVSAGPTTDISSLVTLNGTIYDNNGIPLDGVKVSAVSLEPNISWAVEDTTVGGVYLFRNAPVGARIEIIASKGNSIRKRVEALKSNLNGNPSLNKIDFTNEYALGTTKLEGSVYDGDAKLITSGVEVTGESLDTLNKWNGVAEFKSGRYYFSDVPDDVRVKITVKANDKEKSRTISFLEGKPSYVMNFGGTNSGDKTFALANQANLAAGVNLFVDTKQQNSSSYSLSVKPDSYYYMKKSVNLGSLPSKKDVKIEEYLNYFDYNYKEPENNENVNLNTEISDSPFGGEGKRILRVALKTKDIPSSRKPTSITFLIDTSGSMSEKNKDITLKNTLKEAINKMSNEDKFSIVSYDSSSQTIVENITLNDKQMAFDKIDSINFNGSTNAQAGIEEGLKVARKNFSKTSLNRVLLISDGVEEKEIQDKNKVLEMIKKESDSEISFSTIAISAEKKSDLLEKLAGQGKGYYAYTNNTKDTIDEVLNNITDSDGIAIKNSNISVKFNNLVVKQFRLIGYENSNKQSGEPVAQALKNNHSSTALYEIVLNENQTDTKIADVELNYLDSSAKTIKNTIYNNQVRPFNNTSYSFRLAVTSGLYAEILRGSYWSINNKISKVVELSEALAKESNNNYKVTDFVSIVKKANSL